MNRRELLRAAIAAVAMLFGEKALASCKPVICDRCGTPKRDGNCSWCVEQYTKKLTETINLKQLPFEIEPMPPEGMCPICGSVDVDVTKERKTHLLMDCRNCGVSLLSVRRGHPDAGKFIVFEQHHGN